MQAVLEERAVGLSLLLVGVGCIPSPLSAGGQVLTIPREKEFSETPTGGATLICMESHLLVDRVPFPFIQLDDLQLGIQQS